MSVGFRTPDVCAGNLLLWTLTRLTVLVTIRLEVNALRIIGPPTIEKMEQAQSKVVAQFQAPTLFVLDMLPALWGAGIEHCIDPVGMIAQSIKETNVGRFTGQVKPQFYNTAGIKIRHQELFPGVTDGDRPLAHCMFPNWQVGARAHAQHLRAYTGWPVAGDIVDPRYQFVSGPPAQNWAELGGRWAPGATYGVEIELIMQKLIG